MGKKKMNIPMCVALVLLLLTLVTSHMTSGLYARYTTVNSISASARVAKFQVDTTPGLTDVTVDVAQDSTGAYTFTVTNNSEVVVRYSVIVKMKQPISATMLQIALDSGSYSYLDQNNTVTFPVSQVLAPLGDRQTHTLNFQITPKELFDSVQGEEEINLELEFTVTIRAEQVD